MGALQMQRQARWAAAMTAASLVVSSHWDVAAKTRPPRHHASSPVGVARRCVPFALHSLFSFATVATTTTATRPLSRSSACVPPPLVRPPYPAPPASASPQLCCDQITALLARITSCHRHRGDNTPSTRALPVRQALRLRRSLTRLHSPIATVAIVHGYDAKSLATLRAVGWDVRDVSHVDAASIMKQIPREAPVRASCTSARAKVHTLYTPSSMRALCEHTKARPLHVCSQGYHWPRYRSNVQLRKDNKCRAIHLLAWNMTEWDRIILSDLDLCIAEDPLPWLRRHASSHFIAFNEMSKLRGFRGVLCLRSALDVMRAGLPSIRASPAHSLLRYQLPPCPAPPIRGHGEACSRQGAHGFVHPIYAGRTGCHRDHLCDSDYLYELACARARVQRRR